jgi:hypothetical protein
MTEHFRKYDDLVKKHRLQNLQIDVSAQKIKECYEEDEHLNNIPLAFWDNQAYKLVGTGLVLSERVCLLKHIAINYKMKKL